MSVRTLVIPFYYGSGSGSSSGTVINYGSGSDFLARYGYGSGSASLMLRFLRFRFRFHNAVEKLRRFYVKMSDPVSDPSTNSGSGSYRSKSSGSKLTVSDPQQRIRDVGNWCQYFWYTVGICKFLHTLKHYKCIMKT